MVKTVILDGSELKVSGPDGDNAEIHNFGTGTVYASKFPDIAADADNVIAVSPGAIDGLSGTGGTVYLLGTGKVQVNFTDEKITRTAAAVQSAATSAGTGVSREYVSGKDEETLASAKEYADNRNSETLTAAKEYADTVGADLLGYVGYTANDIYGLEADFENNVFTRLAGAVGKNAGLDFDCVRAYGGRRRCNLSDDGEVLAYYGDENFKADGSNGQVMVEQPRFYYKVVPLKTEKIDGADGYHLHKVRYYISDTPKAGFKVHPAFVRNGVEIEKIYLSAFEGCIYDTSAGAYLLNDEQVADFDNDKLASIAGAKPCSGQSQQLTRANARKLAHNRGEGWEQATIQTVSATQLLFVIEYASFNSQIEIGMGVTSKPDDRQSNLSERTGATEELGNACGQTENNCISYRGEENFYGNIWSWTDGIIVEKKSREEFGMFYVSEVYQNDDPLAETYKLSGIRSSKTQGYMSSFGFSSSFDWIFIPDELSGNNRLPIGDVAYNSASDGSYTPAIGGGWYYGNGTGLFCWHFSCSSDLHSRVIGARLSFFSKGIVE